VAAQGLRQVSGIYRIDLGNGNFYIGSAVNFYKRKSLHQSQLKRGVHGNIWVQSCWNKYQVFIFTVLEECRREDLISREQFYLDTHFSETKNVNISPTAGSILGLVRSAETRAKMSAWQVGKKHSAETKAKIAAARKARGPVSDETRAKMSAASKGVPKSAQHGANIGASRKGKKRPPFSAEWRANIAAAQLGKKRSDETRAKMSIAFHARRAKMVQA